MLVLILCNSHRTMETIHFRFSLSSMRLCLSVCVCNVQNALNRHYCCLNIAYIFGGGGGAMNPWIHESMNNFRQKSIFLWLVVRMFYVHGISTSVKESLPLHSRIALETHSTKFTHQTFHFIR